MASFIQTSLKYLEHKIGYLEVHNLPLHVNERIIDEGAAANVYKFDLHSKDDVAVKSFKQQLPRKRVMQIAVNLRALTHPNIVMFRGFSSRPTALLFEYCHLELKDETVHNLSQLISVFNVNDHFCFQERAEYIQQASQGLNYLHSKGIVHQDFKPNNLLVSGTLKETVVKLCDFDQVFLIKQTVMATATHVDFKGMTLAYVAPELCQRLVRRPSMKSDAYSWAITCFEILCPLPSAWSSLLPVLTDQLLLEALKNDSRPDIDVLKELYPQPNFQILLELIISAWSTDQELRPDTEKV